MKFGGFVRAAGLFWTTVEALSLLTAGCPPPKSIKPCMCGVQSSSSLLSETPRLPSPFRWVNVTCSHANTWLQIRQALRPFRRDRTLYVQTMYIENVNDPDNVRRLNAIFRRVRMVELVVADCDLGRLHDRTFIGSSVTSLHLHNLGLDAVPVTALRPLRSLKQLSLARNRIKAVYSNSFANHPSLKYLDLQLNLLRNVSLEALRPLTQLQLLFLNGNRIWHLPARAFASSPDLRALELSDNDLVSIDSKSLAGLDNLHHLGLAGNPFYYGDSDVLRSLSDVDQLRSLDVSELNISADQWPGSRNLTCLVAQQNQHITVDVLLAWKQLADLDLRGNAHLQPEEFLNGTVLPSVIRLDASETALTVTHLQAFPMLQVAHLNHNYVRRLHRATLAGVRRLAVLHMRNCDLRQIDVDVFWHLRDSLREISLAHNRLNRLNRNVFRKLNGLVVLDLSHNRFADVFNETAKIDRQPLNKRFFGNGTRYTLESLSLAANGLLRIPYLCIQPLIRLKHLDLSMNLIRAVGLEFSSNRQLETLNLEKNKIRSIHPDSFALMTNLRSLNLGQNPLVSVNYVFFPPLIEYLNLAECRLENITNPYMAFLRRLRIVDLSRNSLATFTKHTFRKSAASLISIDLADNKLICDCSLQPFIEWVSENKLVLSSRTLCYIPINTTGLRPFEVSVCWRNCSKDYVGEFSTIPPECLM